MSYVDGFVLPIPSKNIPDYRAIAQRAGEIWREHGALQYVECVGEDLNIKDVLSFSTLAGTGEADTVVFAWIMFRSREHRDEVNKKVMADPRLDMGETMPFDMKRMAYGGFSVLVDA